MQKGLPKIAHPKPGVPRIGGAHYSEIGGLTEFETGRPLSHRCLLPLPGELGSSPGTEILLETGKAVGLYGMPKKHEDPTWNQAWGMIFHLDLAKKSQK